MSNYTTLVYRLLRAISQMESAEERDEHMMLLSPEVLKTTEEARDQAVMKLQKAGLIDGVHILKNVNGMQNPVIIWSATYPSLTHAGMMYLESDPAMVNERNKAKGYSIE